MICQPAIVNIILILYTATNKISFRFCFFNHIATNKYKKLHSNSSLVKQTMHYTHSVVSETQVEAINYL